jgi:hypothetical protein
MAAKNSAKRPLKTPDGAGRAGERGRHSLVSQARNTGRDLRIKNLGIDKFQYRRTGG